MAGLLGLAACATPSNPAMMTLPATAGLIATPGSTAYRSVTTVNVAGGQETNPLWTAQVSDADFKLALENSLGAANYLGTEGRPTVVNATLMALRQPLAGLDISVTSQVRYTVTQSGQPIFDELVAATGTATMSDALIAAERLKMANEKSIQENIRQFLIRFRTNRQ
ncbi:MAG: hypothetical protein Q8S03_16985 [Brevundimonas sp.]|nr:hypothetical protein [Brevundimonas sp.]